MKSRTHSMLLAGLAVAALAVPLTIQTVGAQDAPAQRQGGAAGPGAQRGGGQGQGQAPGFPGQGGMNPMQMMMGGGGGNATMVVDGQWLFILRGNQLFKVQKETLRVVTTGELPMPEMRGPGGGNEFQPQRRGGAGAPPPPTE